MRRQLRELRKQVHSAYYAEAIKRVLELVDSMPKKKAKRRRQERAPFHAGPRHAPPREDLRDELTAFDPKDVPLKTALERLTQ